MHRRCMLAAGKFIESFGLEMNLKKALRKQSLLCFKQGDNND